MPPSSRVQTAALLQPMMLVLLLGLGRCHATAQEASANIRGRLQNAKGQCLDYMSDIGCGWTADYACPGQPPGMKWAAMDDGSLGYRCCCELELWRPEPPAAQEPAEGTPGCLLYEEMYCAASARTNLPGTSFGELNRTFTPSARDCRQFCSNVQGCQFYSFTEQENGDCLAFAQCPAARMYEKGASGTLTYSMKPCQGYSLNREPCAPTPVNQVCEDLVKKSVDKLGQWSGKSEDIGARVGHVLKGNSDDKSGFLQDCCLAGTEYDAFVSEVVPATNWSNFMSTIDKQSALIIVDVQNDFTTGSLAQPCWEIGGHGFINVIVDVIQAFQSKGALIIASKDFHPEDHCSFSGKCKNTKNSDHTNFTVEQRYANYFPEHTTFVDAKDGAAQPQSAPKSPYCKSFGDPLDKAYEGPEYCKDEEFIGASFDPAIQAAIDQLIPGQYEVVFKGMDKDYDSFSVIPHLRTFDGASVEKTEQMATGGYALSEERSGSCHKKWDSDECYPSVDDILGEDGDGMRSALSILNTRDITNVVVVGLVFDYSVAETAAFAMEAAQIGEWNDGVNVTVLADLSRPSFDGKPGFPYTKDVCDEKSDSELCPTGGGTRPSHEMWADYLHKYGVMLRRLIPDFDPEEAIPDACGPQSPVMPMASQRMDDSEDAGVGAGLPIVLAVVLSAVSLATYFVRKLRAGPSAFSAEQLRSEEFPMEAFD